MNISELQKHCKERLEENILPGHRWNIFEWMLKFQEEHGELAQAIIKDKGRQAIQEELADCFIILNFVANHLDIDLQEAIRLKFNDSSTKHGSKIFIPENKV